MQPFVRGTAPTHPAIADDDVWLNDKYQVNINRLDTGWTHLSIKRLDKEAIHDWRELQQIKNMLMGPEYEALELYPAESRLVDTSNQFHLWVWPKGERFVHGYEGRAIVKGHKGGWHQGSGQRDFNEGEEPIDAISKEEADRLMNKYIRRHKK